jgi:hypothetical protein
VGKDRPVTAGVAVVQCPRVGDRPEPLAGSVVLNCVDCQVPIWFHVADHDLGEIRPYCPDCCPRVGPIMFTPGQVDLLRSRGFDDDRIVRLIAVARLTDGHVDRVPALLAEIRVDPGVSRRFAEAVAAAAADLAEVMG